MTIAAGEQALAADLLVALAADGKLLDHDHTGDAGDGGVVGVVPDHDHTGDAGDGGVVSSHQAEVDTRTAGNKTTTSATFVDVDASAFSVTLTTRTGSVLIIGALLHCSNSANAVAVRFDVDLDGSREGGTLYGLSSLWLPALGTIQHGHFVYVKTGLSAGSHTFKLQWLTTGGTATLAANANMPTKFFVVEVY